MGKIICDICGTSYPDTAEQCPICGCTREAAAQMLGEDLLLDDMTGEEKGKSGRLSAKRRKEIFDFDEVNSRPKEPEEDEGSFAEGDDDEEEEDEEGSRPNTGAVILLTVLIAALLIAAAFLLFKYILPNTGNKDETQPAQQTVEGTVNAGATGSIPCETLMLSSGNKAVLNQEGGKFLLHVSAIPSDTTDEIVFSSADESIATVSQDGRIEAVSEGETVVTITCGTKKIECPVIVQYGEGTAPTDAGGDATAAATEPTAAGETAPAATDAPDVKLKLKRTDIKLGVYYQFRLLLDCDLEQDQVEWSSEHPHIATVDDSGLVTAKKAGTTSITAKYGDQEVSCIVRCG